MNEAVIRNAVGSLELKLAEAKDALRQIAADEFHFSYASDTGSWDNPRGALGMLLEQTHDILLVVLEAAGLPETRRALIEAWVKFASGKGKLSHTEEDPQYESSSSPALEYLEHLVSGLIASVTEGVTTQEAWTLNRLEGMLRNTAALVRRYGKVPGGEMDVQKAMGEYLEVCFPSFRRNPPIGGNIKNFKPDFGIADVSAAIEFKIARSVKDVRVALSGIAEDTAGYKGSKDWTRFYAVIYQAEPFALDQQFVSEMKRIGATDWKVILVNFSMKRRSKNAIARSKSKKKTAGKRSQR